MDKKIPRPPDFDQWVKNLGIRTDYQRGDAEVTLHIFEALYDLILDMKYGEDRND